MAPDDLVFLEASWCMSVLHSAGSICSVQKSSAIAVEVSEA